MQVALQTPQAPMHPAHLQVDGQHGDAQDGLGHTHLQGRGAAADGLGHEADSTTRARVAANMSGWGWASRPHARHSRAWQAQQAWRTSLCAMRSPSLTSTRPATVRSRSNLRSQNTHACICHLHHLHMHRAWQPDACHVMPILTHSELWCSRPPECRRVPFHAMA